LDRRVQDLIRMAWWDLSFGPRGEECETEWPGFEKACDEIAAAISEAPRTLWIDTGCDYSGRLRCDALSGFSD
jgi:hypothetical protein